MFFNYWTSLCLSVHCGHLRGNGCSSVQGSSIISKHVYLISHCLVGGCGSARGWALGTHTWTGVAQGGTSPLSNCTHRVRLALRDSTMTLPDPSLTRANLTPRRYSLKTNRENNYVLSKCLNFFRLEILTNNRAKVTRIPFKYCTFKYILLMTKETIRKKDRDHHRHNHPPPPSVYTKHHDTPCSTMHDLTLINHL